MATAVNLVNASAPFGISLVVITLFCVVTTVYIPYATYVKVLKWFALTVAAYIITAFFVHHLWSEVFHALLVPQFTLSKEFS
jgi:Mn2+/Fe2+ NRAMP family transporter